MSSPMPWPLVAITPMHPERLIADADDLADRIGVLAEELRVDGRAEHGDLGGARHVLRAEEGAASSSATRG